MSRLFVFFMLTLVFISSSTHGQSIEKYAANLQDNQLSHLEKQKSAKTLSDLLWQSGDPQQAIWALYHVGLNEEADTLRNKLEETIKTGNLIKVEPSDKDYVNIGSGASRPSLYRVEGTNFRVIVKLGQDVSETEPAAYHLDKLNHLNIVPTTLSKQVGEYPGSVQLFIPNAKDNSTTQNEKYRFHFGKDAPYPQFLNKMFILDYILVQGDRSGKNWMTGLWGNIIAIDNAATLGGAFGTRWFRNAVFQPEHNLLDDKELLTLMEFDVQKKFKDTLEQSRIDIIEYNINDLIKKNLSYKPNSILEMRWKLRNCSRGQSGLPPDNMPTIYD